MIVGAPGSHSWRGMIFNKLLTDSIEVDNYWVKSPLADSHGEPITKFYSYLGRFGFNLFDTLHHVLIVISSINAQGCP